MAENQLTARSMTGYGKGEADIGGVRCLIEIRSVNHRYRDVAVKAPRALLCLEERVKKAVCEKLARGKIDVFITLEDKNARPKSARADIELARSALLAVRKISEALGIDMNVGVSEIIRIPDVILYDDLHETDENRNNSSDNSQDQEAERMWNCVGDALSKALDAINAARAREGDRLVTDIAQKLNYLDGILGEVAERSPLIPAEYKRKLEIRISDMLGVRADSPLSELDASRIATEAALFADRCCVDEELVRLRSHFTQMREAMYSNEPVGRKMDFLTQEINREINTIGSKANDLMITESIVKMKSEAEKIREQIQNLE